MCQDNQGPATEGSADACPAVPAACLARLRAVAMGSQGRPRSAGKLRGRIAMAVVVAIGAGIPMAQADDATTLDTVEVHGQRPDFRIPRPASVGAGYISGGSNAGFIDVPMVHDDGNQPIALQDPSPKECDKQVGNPIVFSTGNKIEVEHDFSALGEFGLYLDRTYNGRGWSTGLFGPKWISSFESYLRTFDETCRPVVGAVECDITDTWPSSLELHLQRPDGRLLKFTRDDVDGNYYTGKPTPVSKLVWQVGDTWLLYNEDHTIERYSKGGFLLEIKNEHGVGWTMTYGGANGTQLQRVTHTSGRYVQFGWTNNRVTTAIDPAGNTYAYTYTDGRLNTVSLPGDTTVTYHYQGAAILTGKSINGVRHSTFGYDAGGRAASTEHAGGVERYTVEYTLGPRYVPHWEGFAQDIAQVVVTNPLGKQTTYKVVDGKITDVTGSPSANCPISFKTRTYDAFGYDDLVTDFEGNVTDYDYDGHGHLHKKVDAHGTTLARTTTYTWDEANNRLIRVTTAGDSETSYTYTPNGRLASVSVKNLSGKGVANQVRTTEYRYTYHGGGSSGLLATMVEDGPLANDAVTSTFSATGDLLTVKNGLGHTTTFADYNGLGQPRKVTGPNGDVTEYTYDGRGRAITVKVIVNGTAQTTTYTYDAAGRLITILAPDGVTTNREYDDAGRLFLEYQPEPGGTFAVKLYTYNNASQVTSVTVQRATEIVRPPVSVPATFTVPATSNNGAFTISWSSVGTATRYELQQRKDGGGWSKIHDAAGTSKAVSGLTNGSYDYRVRACNVGGCAAYTTTKTTVVTHLPSVPTTFTVPATSNNGSFTVSWSSVGMATRYELEQRKDSGNWSKIHDATGTSKAVSGLTNGSYEYRVRACNAGGCGGYSAVKITVVTHPPSIPATLTVPVASNNGSFAVSWSSASTATRYELEQRKDGGSWSKIHDAAGTSKAVSGLTNGSYDYRVRACNVGGCSGYSAVKTTVVTFPPTSAPSLAAPSNVDVQQSFTVSWTAVGTATRYELQVNPNASGWSTVHDGAALSVIRSHNLDGSFSYRVRACNVGGCGPFSATKTVHVVDVGGGGPCVEGVCPEPDSDPDEEEM